MISAVAMPSNERTSFSPNDVVALQRSQQFVRYRRKAAGEGAMGSLQSTIRDLASIDRCLQGE